MFEEVYKRESIRNKLANEALIEALKIFISGLKNFRLENSMLGGSTSTMVDERQIMIVTAYLSAKGLSCNGDFARNNGSDEADDAAAYRDPSFYLRVNTTAEDIIEHVQRDFPEVEFNNASKSSLPKLGG